MAETVKRIFMGGSGRSGTTLLYNCIGQNPDIFILPENSESRFIIDHDGVLDLIDNLTTKFDIGRATETIRRFRALMTVYLTHPHDAPYFGKNFANWFGSDFYYTRVNSFIEDLVIHTFIGSSLTTHGSKSKGKIIQYAWKLQEFVHRVRFNHGAPISLPVIFPEQYNVRHFERDEIVGLCADFIDDLFMHGAEGQNKKTWCEKTPSNIEHFSFIKELFPESLFVHILRDPRGTVASMLNVPWAPNNVKDVSIFLRGIYQRWFILKNSLNIQRDYIEFKLEDFVQKPEFYLDKISSSAGVRSIYEPLPEMSYSRINSWKDELSQCDINTMNSILKNEIKSLGYEC